MTLDAEETAFRRAERERCLALRAAAPASVRSAVQANVDAVVDLLLRGAKRPSLAFYWPIRGEIALFGAMRRAVDAGATVALPVVVDRHGPLAFRRWTPATRMEPGVWKIPVPPDSAEPVDPDVLFVPVVGYDAANFRLGNGGGYYDRTLAARSPRPRTVGIGMTCLRLATFRPAAHDLPMDLMVTEAPVAPRDRATLSAWVGERIDCASPPCAMPELDT